MKTHLILISILIFSSASICKAQTTVQVNAIAGASKHIYEDNTDNKSVFGGGFGGSVGKKDNLLYYSVGLEIIRTGNKSSGIEFEAYHISVPLSLGISGSKKITPYAQGTIKPSYVAGVDINSIFLRDEINQYRDEIRRINLSVGANAGLALNINDRYIKIGIIYETHLTSIHKKIDDFPQLIGANISIGFNL